MNDIERVLSANTHYEVLNISQTATTNVVRKAYHKLALRVHPDKCNHKRAEDAFKRVQHAHDVLGDADKRQHYDAFGDEDTTSTIPQPDMRRRTYVYSTRGFTRMDEEMTPEEILFQHIFGQAGSGWAQRRRQPRREEYESPSDGSKLAQVMLQLLPLVLMMIFAISGLQSREMPPTFSFEYSTGMDVRRVTTSKDIDLPYFVSAATDVKLNRDPSLRARLESEVEMGWFTRLKNECEAQRRLSRSKTIPACDQFVKIRNNIFDQRRRK